VLEDMIRMYVIQQPNKWEYYLHLVEFSYNNSYHESTKMNPFEMLNGRKCKTTTNKGKPKDKLLLGFDMLAEMELTIKKV